MLVLIRGLPGSGKTTLAKKLMDNPYHRYAHYEADKLFELETTYDFRPKLLKAAHAYCFGNTARALLLGTPVIVSNTFTQQWEMDNYVEAAKELGTSVKIIRCMDNFGSVHGVPVEKVIQMANRFEANEDLTFDYEHVTVSEYYAKQSDPSALLREE